VNVWSLGSGSRGNGLVIASGDRAILVDCGFGPRALALRLKRLGLAPEMIAALVLTHEHQDHADGAARAQHKWRWPVYASAGTHRGVADIPGKMRQVIAAGGAVSVAGFTLEAVAIPHDAAEPLALAVTDEASGARVGVAHDLGAVPAALERLFARCDALLLEANHDVDLLRRGPYPPSLQARIRGGRGHLNNDEAAALAVRLAHPGLQALALLHLSEANNTPAEAAQCVNRALAAAGVAVRAHPAAGRTPDALVALGPRPGPLRSASAAPPARVAAATQLTLAL
jgi:phosphoribosyl 1,2-cyclic phosphodiesterase